MKTTNHTNPCTFCPIGISDPSLCKGCAYNGDKKRVKITITITTIQVEL